MNKEKYYTNNRINNYQKNNKSKKQKTENQLNRMKD